MDLAEGHVAAVANVLKNAKFGCQAINLGTGTGEEPICPSQSSSTC